MNVSPHLQTELASLVEKRRDRLIEITQKLVRIPSENTPPEGAEKACQLWLAEQLQAIGLEPDIYFPNEVAGLREHALFWGDREYGNRPNLAAKRKGRNGGRSLLLSGHIDTVPRGTQPWTRNPFSGDVEGNRLYGRGSNDMKAGIAASLFVFECLAGLGLELGGDLVFESVIDEEFGGCNGTLAGRVRGYNTDAAIITEPSSLRICPAQRGGRTAHITFHGTGGVLQQGELPAGVVPQLTQFLTKVESFAQRRRSGMQIHPMYAGNADPVPVLVTKVFTAPWGFTEPITIPETAQVELYWQLMPGETQAEVESQFHSWLDEVVSSAPMLFPARPTVTFPIRWMPGSAIGRSEAIVEELAACAKAVLKEEPKVAGIEGPCDLFVFQQGFNIPSVLWGPRGGNTHAADEYVEIDSLIGAAKTLLLFAAEWCGAIEN